MGGLRIPPIFTVRDNNVGSTLEAQVHWEVVENFTNL